MKIKNTVESVFLTLTILALIVNTREKAFAQGYTINRPVVKVAYSTFHLHDEIEIHKVFDEEFLMVRKRVRNSLRYGNDR
jgi:hypothetical protein